MVVVKNNSKLLKYCELLNIKFNANKKNNLINFIFVQKLDN